MVNSNSGSLPQWIELYNKSNIDEVNLDKWKLIINNYHSEDYNGKLYLEFPLSGYSIKPNATLLIVSRQGRSSDNFQKEQIYNLDTTHSNLQDIVLNEKGFTITLTKRWRPVDEIGNLDRMSSNNDRLKWKLSIGMT